MEDTARWTRHSAFSDPGRHADALAALPDDIGTLNGIIQGILIHADWLKEYNLDPSIYSANSRGTLPVAERLDDILGREPSPLHAPRAPDRRSAGTCRDFALMLCSILRAKAIPARVRCGYAAYFDTEWEDHWICEYRDAATGTWRLADAQVDAMLRQRNGIAFDAADMPRQFFMPAGEAWQKHRSGEADAARFGHGDVTGPWFIKVNVLRDHHVLNGRETSSWDRWREAPQAARKLSDAELRLLDALAAHPAQPLIDNSPDWL